MILLACSVALNVGLAFLLVRIGRRLLQFDEALAILTEPMQDYAEYLKKVMDAEGVLHDSPEIVAFHKANRNALKLIEGVIQESFADRPKKPRLSKLPRPVVR
jgi:hypothetical protein